MANDRIWPLKIVRVEDGIVCIFDRPSYETGTEPGLEVLFLIDEWVVVYKDEFCIPVSTLKVEDSDDIILYLFGSGPDALEADLFATIPLGIRDLTKIGMVVEFGTPPPVDQDEGRLQQAA